jgi:hypothetical protein
MTEIRCGKKFRLATAVQTAEGTPATSPQETLWAQNGAWASGSKKQDIAGSYGRITKPSYARLHQGIEPTLTAKFVPTKKMLPLILRSNYGKSRIGETEVTKTGDTHNELRDIKLTGILPYFNTDAAWKLYAKLFADAGNYKVEIYKAVGMAPADLVCSGQATAAPVINDLALAEANNSGISGTIDVYWTDGEAAVTFLINTLIWDAVDNIIEKYLTFWFEDGVKTIRFTDAWVKKLTLDSGERRTLEATIEVVAKNWESLSLVTIPIPTLFEAFCHKKLILIDETLAPTMVNLAARNFRVDFENEGEVFVGNSFTPLKIIKEAFAAVKGNLKSKMSTEMYNLLIRTLKQDPMTFNKMRVQWELSPGVGLELYMPAVDFTGEMPAFAENKFEDFDSDFESCGDSEPLQMKLGKLGEPA